MIAISFFVALAVIGIPVAVAVFAGVKDNDFFTGLVVWYGLFMLEILLALFWSVIYLVMS